MVAPGVQPAAPVAPRSPNALPQRLHVPIWEFPEIRGTLFWAFQYNQGEKSINFYFIMVPLRKKVLKYGTPKPSILGGPYNKDPTI